MRVPEISSSTAKSQFFAHSRAHRVDRWHPLATHLHSVAAMAKASLATCAYAEEAYLAGLLHDLGKYGDLFQQRLRNPQQVSGLDHWSQGAFVAISRYKALAAAFAIQGHHIGIQSYQGLKNNIRPDQLRTRHPLNLRLSDDDPDRLLQRLWADELEVERPSEALLKKMPEDIGDMLDIRRLFSALVDADFLDTEAHFQRNEQGKVYRDSGLALQAEVALQMLLRDIEQLAARSDSTAPVNQVRRELLVSSLAQAEQPSGLFTLTAPTGSGKTLSMLAFALKHAAAHGFTRIVMVIPYLTIIEQTANIYRNIFASRMGDHYILEHHSMAGLGDEYVRDDAVEEFERRRRLLAENWDAPIIVTTSVQLLESLFSNRPSTCRKLHRLAKSVILFDEVQTLPTNLAVPTLAALSHLAEAWHSSIVFSTATQPAFEHLDDAVKRQNTLGWRPREIVASSRQMTERLRRVRYHWPKEGDSLDWSELAEQLAEVPLALCIVNLKKHARTLWETLDDSGVQGVHHLSTNLCPLHREAVLDEVRKKLTAGERCHLVATQCVEAGVDIDFPHVWRAIGPLDSIIQAGGRCNREGRRSHGDMHVFVPTENPYPPMPGYLQATKTTEYLLRTVGVDNFDLYDSSLIRRYYETLYALNNPDNQAKDIRQAVSDIDFPEVARQYRLIKQDAINVLVPYNVERKLYEALAEDAGKRGLSGRWIRRARGLTVSLFRPKPEQPIWDSLIPVVHFRGGKSDRNDWFVYVRDEHYHPVIGLIPPDHLNLWIA
ncbi:MAG: CRISPR-associated helicase Cas3' [Gammaproteobacteria bacterium]